MVLLAHLRSYEGMGLARLSCATHCTCLPVVINAHYVNPQLNVSVTSFTPLAVSAHTECVMQVSEALGWCRV